MIRIANWKIVWVSLSLLGGHASANELDAVDGPNVRVMKNEDGGQTIFSRSADKRTLTKKTFKGGNLAMVAIYRMDVHGNPMSCKIIDGQQNELFKVSYGYHRETGQLLEERMFDSRVKRINKDTGKEQPVQRLIYLPDPQGNRGQPIAINLLPGKKFQDVFGEKSTALDANPFDDGKAARPANPNARGVGRGN
ncbi:hypothetical protein OVA24_04280 [Luteolibacter sp. SL250]|uniref:hypothetical protein n=1 Tax=Luteolibacter sp. SL250 TaxID=2995170 RepID=UPI002270A1DA|nr:hypothetical protein [Luteolibacter sp. SL250]WAC20595.1 hypothetical protein OVA24_04280 [Luteolibacter sp. SL250]